MTEASGNANSMTMLEDLRLGEVAACGGYAEALRPVEAAEALLGPGVAQPSLAAQAAAGWPWGDEGA